MDAGIEQGRCRRRWLMGVLCGAAASASARVGEPSALAQTCDRVRVRTTGIIPGSESGGVFLCLFGERLAITGNNVPPRVWDGSGAQPVPFDAWWIASRPPRQVVGRAGGWTYYTTWTGLYQSTANEGSARPVGGWSRPVILDDYSFAAITLGDGLLMAARRDASSPIELLFTDGTDEGTRSVQSSEGRTLYSPRGFTRFGSRMFFFANDGRAGVEPYVTDGTSAGTRALGDIAPGTSGSWYYDLDYPKDDLLGQSRIAVDGDRLYFSVLVNQQRRLYVTDGTPEGTGRMSIDGVDYDGLVSPGRGGVFVGGLSAREGGELFFSTGEPGATRLVRDFYPGGQSGVVGNVMRTVGGRSVFHAWDGAAYGLWSARGTEAPVLLRSDSSSLLGAVVRSRLVFAEVAEGGHRLGVSDGTPDGTCVQREVGIGAPSASVAFGRPSFLWARTTPSRVFLRGFELGVGLRVWAVDLCPADFNNTGGDPNAQDIFDFLGAFFAGDIAADFNESGTINAQDVIDFLRAWFEGCES